MPYRETMAQLDDIEELLEECECGEYGDSDYDGCRCHHVRMVQFPNRSERCIDNPIRSVSDMSDR